MTDQPKIFWQPHPGKQTLALKQTEFEILYGGARGGGKTDGGMAWLLRPFVDYPEIVHRYRALIIRKNAKDLRDWNDRAKLFYRNVGGKVVGSPPEIRFDNGALFRTGHIADANAYNQYIGHEYQRINWEELTQTSKEIDYLKVLSSCRSTNGIEPQIFCTTNPGNVGHVWVKKRWGIPDTPPPYRIKLIKDKETRRTRIFIPSKLKDNPTLVKSDPGYAAFLNGLPEPLRSAWKNGDWSVFSGQFFTQFHSVRHGIQPFKIAKHWDLIGGLDYGETAHTAFGLYTIDTANNWKIRIGEYYKPGLAPSENARNIVQFCKENKWTDGRLPSRIYADPSMWVKRKTDERREEKLTDKSPAEIFRDYDLFVMQANNDRIPGWSACRESLNEDKFKYFLGENDNFEELIPAQVHDQGKMDRGVEDLKKCAIDHIPDEWRYFTIMTRGDSVSAKDIQQEIEERDIKRKAESRMFETLDESINTH